MAGEEDLTQQDTVPRAVTGIPDDVQDLRQQDPLRYPPHERYVENDEVGRGASGRVILAFDRRIGRTVARKELSPGEGTTISDVHRFTREVWITGQLEHPGIVPIYDAGLTSGGEHYYTMPYVAGQSLRQAFASKPRLEDRLHLLTPFARVCEAVAFAHSKGVIHRDLKPANIMMGPFGKTFVVDWGLARVVDSPESHISGSVQSFGSADETSHGDVLGTPSYMSPEQARGETADERSDVWGLGAILYHLLAGDTPVRVKDKDAVKKIIERVGRADIPSIDERAPEAPPELRAIVRRAMQPDADARYEHAGALADDLQAYLDGRRVKSYEYSTGELVVRFARRHRWALTGVAAGLAIIAGMSIDSYRRTSAERDRARQAERVASSERDRAVEAEAEANRLLVETLSEKARAAADLQARAEAEVLAAHALARGPSPDARGVLARFAATPRAARIDSWRLPEGCRTPRLDPDGKRLLCRVEGGLALWPVGADAPTWTRELEFSTADFANSTQVVVRDSKTVHTLSAVDGHETGLVEGKRSQVETVPGGRFASLDFRYVEVHGKEEPALRVDPCAEQGTQLFSITSDLSLVAAYCNSAQMMFGAPDSPRAITLHEEQAPMTMRFEPEGTRLAVGRVRGRIDVIDGRTGEPLQRLLDDAPLVLDLVWSPDGKRLAALHEDRSISLFETNRPGALARFPARGTGAPSVVFTAQGELVTATTSVDRWRLPTPWPPARVRVEHGASHAALSPDGKRIATIHGDGGLRVWRKEDGLLETDQRWQERVGKRVAWSPDGRWLAAVAASEHGVSLWKAGEWDERRELGEESLSRVSFTHSGTALVALPYSAEAGIPVWSIPTFELTRVPTEMGRPVDLYVTPGGDRTVIVDEHATVFSLDLDGDAWSFRELYRGEDINAIAISADGGSLVAIENARRLNVIDLETGRVVRTLDGPGQLLLDVAIAPGGRYLAIPDQDRSVHVLEFPSLATLATLRGHDERVVTAEFGSTSLELVSASWDGSARLWNLSPLAASPSDLLAEIDRAWELDIETAISAPIR